MQIYERFIYLNTLFFAQIRIGMMQTPRFIILLFLALLYFNADAQTAPTIQLCNQAAPEICMDSPSLEICVTFVIDSTYDEVIDHYELDWLDGSPSLMLPANDSLNDQTHTYDVSNIFGNCVWENEGFRVRLRSFLANGSAPNSSVDLFLRNPARASISAPPTIACTGTEICFTDSSCPTEQLTSTWDFGEGRPPTDNNCYTYQDTGNYVVTLMAENPCGQDTAQVTVQVVAAPSAVAVPRGDVVQGTASPYRVCIDGQTCIALDGTGTAGADLLEWTVDAPASFVTITNPDSLVAEVCFLQAREYVFTLTASNTNCEIESVASFMVNAVIGEALLFTQQPDACPELSYTPSPGVDPNATYFIDGMEVSNFPFQMNARAAPYIIRAEKSTECSMFEANDTIFVDAAIQPSLQSPSDGDALCPDTSLVELQVSDLGGTWTPTTGLVLMGEDAFFDQSVAPGNYNFTYTLGSGDCQRSLNFSLSLQASELQLPPDFLICVTGAPVSLTPSPNDGLLSGDGVDNTARTFSPAGLTPGTYPIAYSRSSMVTTSGCDEVGSWNAEVVAEPRIDGLTPISLCNTDQTLDLLAQTSGVSFSPVFAETTFSGRGIVDGTTGTYRPANLAVGEVDTVLITLSDPRTPNRCSTTDTLLITITGIIIPEAGQDTIVCGASNTYFLGDPAGGRWSGPSASEDGTIDLSALTPNTYTYTLTLGTGFCESSDEVDITVASGDGVTVAEPAAFVCDTATQLSLPNVMAAEAGTWAGDLPIAEPFIDLTGATVGTYNFLYTVASLPAGCNSAPFSVEIFPRPTTTLSGDSLGCNDGSCIVFLTGGTPADTYRWQATDGLNTSGDSICHQFPDAGDYVVSVAGERRNPITNAVLCRSEEASLMVRVLAPPQPATIVAAQDTVCPGEGLVLNFTPPTSAGQEALGYEWEYGDTTFVADGPTEISFPSPTEDTVYNIALNTLGTCGRAQNSIEVVVRANPNPRIGVVYPENCSGSELILTNLATGTLDFFEWFTSDGQRYSTFQPPITRPVTGENARTIVYALITENSCLRDTASVPIIVEPTTVRALPSFTDTTVCVGEPFIVNNISTPNARVEYLFSDGRRFAADSIGVTFSEPGPFSFTIYAFGCGFDSSTWQGNVLPDPEIDFDAGTFTCPYAEFPYTLTSDAANTMVYFGDGDSTNQNIGTHAYLPTTDALLVRYAATSNEGCRVEGSQQLQVLPQPVAAIGAVDTLCANQEQAFVSTGTGGATCRWEYGDGQGGDGCETAHQFAEDGLYSLELIYTSLEGCADTAYAPAYVRPSPDIAVQLTFDDSQCGPTNVLFEYIGNLQQASSFQLFPGDGSGPIMTESPTHLFDTSGQITAMLRTGFDDVCFMDTEVSFYLRQYPRARTQVQDERCEQGESLSLAVLTENPEDIIMASGPEGYFSEGINLFNLVAPGDYTVEVVSPDGCDTLIDFSVAPVRVLRLSTINNDFLPLGDSIELRTEVNSTDVLFSWSPGASLSDSVVKSPLATPFITTTYIIEAIDTVTTCTRKDSVRIGVVQDVDIYVPSAFSPNGDGINDGFTIFPKASVTNIKAVRIFDRWGGVAFEQERGAGASIPPLVPLWDGRTDGKQVNSGVYIYMIEYETVTGETKYQRGDLTVLGKVGR